MFLVLIFKENGLFTLLKLGFASQNCGCTLVLQEKLKASPELEPPAKSAPLKSIKPPEWPSPQPSPYPQPQPPLMGNPEPLRVAGGGPLWVHGATGSRRVESPGGLWWTRPNFKPFSTGHFPLLVFITGKLTTPFLRIPNASQGWWSSLCSLISLLGMTVNSGCRCS